jgi:predicted nucleic acid-binding protein
MFSVILDANVLVPANLCDLLLRTAIAGLYHAYWSDDILEEVGRVLVRLGVDEERARRRIATMKAIPAVTVVTGYQALIPVMPCAEGDRHVQAAALLAGAELIVTNNLADFPPSALSQYNMQAKIADEFLLDCFVLDPSLLADVVRRQAADLQHPPMTMDEVLAGLEKQVPRFVSALWQFMAERQIVPFPAVQGGDVVDQHQPPTCTR